MRTVLPGLTVLATRYNAGVRETMGSPYDARYKRSSRTGSEDDER